MKNNIDISVNTQSSIKISINGIVIYFDPYKIDDVRKDADYIFITHPHYDHFDINSINNVIKDSSIIIGPSCINDIDIDYKVKPLDKFSISNINVSCRYAYNINKEYHKKEYNWVGYIIEVFGVSFYIVGDSDVLEENCDIDVDYCFIPIGGVYTMDYIEASNYINNIRPNYVIPTHYGSIVGDKNLGILFKDRLNDNIDCLINIYQEDYEC